MAADSCSLSKEKVWVDKSSYDKAECLYQERLGKDVQPLTGDDSPLGVTNSTKKNKKSTSKQNNPTTINNDSNSTETTKSSKKKNKKKEAKAAEALLDNVAIKTEDSEISQGSVKETPTASNKKLKAKEAKEEKNKADKKQKNADQDKATIVNQENKDQETSQGTQFSAGGLASEVAKARAHIKQSLQCMDGIAALAGLDSDFSSRVVTIEKQNQDLRNTVQELMSHVKKLESRVKELESKCGSQGGSAPQIAICPAKPAPKKEEKKEEKKDDDEDIDLFGSDSEGEDAEAQKVREERLAAYAAKKSKKPVLIAKSSLILDVKPWDDETDMKVLENEVRKIETDGLLWGASKLVPVAYNIKKLQITCVVEDDKVSIDWLTEQIQEIEDYVQSVDIAAFNKI